MDWSPQQTEALDRVSEWLENSTPIFRLFGFAGTGKQERNGTLIPTPEGSTAIENLCIGDTVFHSSGKPQKVTGVFPQGRQQTYKITFRDGFSTYAGKDHLWAVWTHKLRATKKDTVLKTTEDLMKSGLRFKSGPYKYCIPLCLPIQYSIKNFSIDPYLLGVLIGDGTNLGKTPTISTPNIDKEIIKFIEIILPLGMKCKKYTSSNCPRYTLSDPTIRNNRLAQRLRKFNLNILSPNRFIPDSYKRGSVEQRLDLLKGLMDTDGSCEKNRTSFSSMSKKLAYDVAEIVQSLGGTAIVAKYDRGIKGIEYSVNVKMFVCPFRLRRKAKNWSFSKKNPPSRYIINIEKVKNAEHTCISVNSPDGLYLTNHYIVTHNTTLAKHFSEGINGKVFFGAYTGKAAMVLRSKGCYNASTIHKLIYLPKEKSRVRLARLRLAYEQEQDEKEKVSLKAQIIKEEENLKRPAFVLNIESEIQDAKLVILDEVSMVGKTMANDILSFDVPVLALGDPAQLPPVGDAGFFTNTDSDFMLTEIHRQAENSPIIKIATKIRKRKSLEYGEYDESLVCKKGVVSLQNLSEYDQIIVGKNVTRKFINRELRNKILKRISHLPEEGDLLICLKNNQKNGLLNGSQWIVLDSEMVDDDLMHLHIKSVTEENGISFNVIAFRHYFEDREKEIPHYEMNDADHFDFGYAITCHKSQGSQWNSVCVIDESQVFRNNQSQWLYTAVTRASERVTVITNGGT